MSFTLIRVGTVKRPASLEDILDIRQKVRELAKDKGLSLVTHHCIEFEEVYCSSSDHRLVYKVGTPEQPATTADIESLQEELKDAAEECRPVVTHYAVQVTEVKVD